MFKRSLTVVLLLLSTVAGMGQIKDSVLSELYESETSHQMREDVSYLSSAMLEGRKAGSEGEKMAACYVYEQMAKYGVEMLSAPEGDIFGLKGEGDTLVSRNVIGFIQGYDRKLKDHFIVIGARLDNMGTAPITVNGEKKEQIYYGANGNASGLAMLLELSRKLQTNSVLLRRSVLLVAFGASGVSNAGSWYFLNRSFKNASNIDAMINLDMVGIGTGGFYAYTASNPDMNNFLSRLEGSLQPVYPTLVSMEPCPSDHRSFYERQIPSVFFTTGMYPQYRTPKDTADILDYPEMEKETEYVYNYALALIGGPKPIFNQTEELAKKHRDDSEVVPYNRCDVPPTFLGSSEPSSFLIKWVYTYLRYPKMAVSEGIQGKVLVDFIVDEKGKVRDVKVLRGVDPLLDEEAVRVVSASPDWKPGKVRGQKVKSEISLYVEFKLKKNK